MKKMIPVAAALLFAAAAHTAASAQTITTHQYEQAIQVMGKAERKITPDEIFVAITLKDNEPKGQTVEMLELLMKREFTALGIDLPTDLRVTSMTNAPRRRNDVTTSRTYELKVGDAATLGAVFETLGEMGVTQAGVARTSHSRIEEIRGEVRVEAIRNARAMANELAGAIGQSIGPAVWIDVQMAYQVGYSSTAMMIRGVNPAYAGGDAGSVPTLEMQDITLSADVIGKFVLNPR